MTPTVTRLTSLDIYRDGGSLSTSFIGQEANIQYCLLFPIMSSPAFDDSLKSYSYRQPVLEIYKTVPYVSPKTGFSNPITEKKTIQLSWAEARSLLRSIEPYMPGFESDYVWVFEAMLSAASNRGTRTDT
jgi:hypothetical protein